MAIGRRPLDELLTTNSTVLARGARALLRAVRKNVEPLGGSPWYTLERFIDFGLGMNSWRPHQPKKCLKIV